MGKTDHRRKSVTNLELRRRFKADCAVPPQDLRAHQARRPEARLLAARCPFRPSSDPDLGRAAPGKNDQ